MYSPIHGHSACIDPLFCLQMRESPSLPVQSRAASCTSQSIVWDGAVAWGRNPAKHVGMIVVVAAESIGMFQADMFEVALV
jgi:hypothetical protein